jgi:uncharacterized protein (TIGR02147 family)
MRQKFDRREIQRLAESRDYRMFIKTALELKSARGRRFGYADLSRHSGIASRGFLHDVVAGKKRLSPESMHKVARGLGLPADVTELFRSLVELEHPDCRARTLSSSRIERNIANLKERILAKSSVYLKSPEEAFSDHRIPIVYAALGDEVTGAKFTEIKSRTKISVSDLSQILEKMIELGIVGNKNEFYFAQQGHLSLQHLQESEVFRDFFLHHLRQAESAARTHFKSDRHLFFTSAFSVREKDMAKIKEDLRATLLKYVDQAEEALGDTVVSLACSIFA